MKHCAIALLTTLIAAPVTVLADAAIDRNEKNIWIPADFVRNGITNYIPAIGRDNATKTYTSVMNPENGKVSSNDLENVCAAGTLDLSTADGLASCRAFVEYLMNTTSNCMLINGPECTEESVTFDKNELNVFCPATGNKLGSITASTEVGDICSSTNIAYGTVYKKSSGVCSCEAAQCNNGYRLEAGQCAQIPAGTQLDGSCRRLETAITNAKTLPECKQYCAQRYSASEFMNGDKRKCLYKATAISTSLGMCICNPSDEEIAGIKAAHQQQKRKNVKYFQVCGDQRGKSGGKEYCVTEIFDTTQVQQLQGIALAQEYARVRNGHNILCDKAYTPRGNDDYLQCADIDNKIFYEFRFDDLQESGDGVIHRDTASALCMIYGGKPSSYRTNTLEISDFVYCGNMSEQQCRNMQSVKDQFALSIVWDKTTKNCSISSNAQYLEDDYTLDLATIDGINNCAFYMGGNIQVKSDTDLVKQLESYARRRVNVRNFRCNSNKTTVDSAKAANFCGVANKGNKQEDDVLRCYVNDVPVDFVFDDLSEISRKYDQGGKQAMNCIAFGGTFNGETCMHLSKSQCDRIGEKYRTRFENGQCVLIDANVVDNMDAVNRFAQSAGIGLAALGITIATGGTGALVFVGAAGTLVAAAGTYSAITSAAPFFEESQKCYAVADNGATMCKSTSCATTMFDAYYKRLNNLSEHLNPAELGAVDDVFAKLAECVPENHQIFRDIEQYHQAVASVERHFEPEQIAIFVGNVLSLGSSGVSAISKVRTAGNVAKSVGSSINGFTKTVTTLTNRASDVIDFNTINAYR